MSAKIIRTINEMHGYSNNLIMQGKKIGLVPTMGFLHEGHLSLVRKSNELCDATVVSIFVNPAQFSPTEDLDKYPRDFDHDEELLNANGANAIFYPSVQEIYPDEFQTYVDVNKVTKTLEGEKRPTHFKGVSTIVTILFNAVKPNVAVFGQKDAQQATVIKRMTADLKMDIQIVVEPIVRETDGLAMSSRNVYLSPEERKDSLVLSRTLKMAEKLISDGTDETDKIISAMKSEFEKIATADLDYISIVNAATFQAVEKLEKGNEYFILEACKIGKTRLIDNSLVKL